MPARGELRFEAHVHVMFPLNDQETEGNLGLMGWDEGGESRRFPTEPLAKAWLARTLSHQPNAAGELRYDGWIDELIWDTRDGGYWCESRRHYYEALEDGIHFAGQETHDFS